MVKQVIQLGVKGQDLVLATLKKIQKGKDQFKKAATLAIGAAGGRAVGAQQQPTDESGKEERKASETAKRLTDQLINVGHGLATLQGGAAAKALSQGIAGMFSVVQPELAPWSNAVAQSLGMIVDSATNFVNEIKNAASITADTADQWSRARNLMGAGNENFLKMSRVDIDTNSRRAIIEGLGAKYGIVQDHLRRSVERLFGNNQNPTDVRQATELAQGHFEALGNDQGFFMQKIADSFGGLPPSIKQELTSQMLDMVPDSMKMRQSDAGNRAVVTNFDNMTRDRAAAMTSPQNVQLANSIQGAINSADDALVNGLGELGGKITSLITEMKGLGDKIKQSGSLGAMLGAKPDQMLGLPPPSKAKN